MSVYDRETWGPLSDTEIDVINRHQKDWDWKLREFPSRNIPERPRLTDIFPASLGNQFPDSELQFQMDEKEIDMKPMFPIGREAYEESSLKSSPKKEESRTTRYSSYLKSWWKTTDSDSDAFSTSLPKETISRNPSPERKEKLQYVKSLRLTSDQLKSLNLKQGPNSIRFTVGTAECNARIFFWDRDSKIVISDIDGTITKSDALGHIFTMVGKDWTHPGVAKLYTNISRNGYQLIYLTSRAIGQSAYTRDYLSKIEQEGYTLPDGPVILSPDRTLRALHREVIRKRPEEFKMACLRDLKALFGKDVFYAGFGNRITDALSYRSVNIPSSRIFTIDPTGEVRLQLVDTYKSSYISLSEVVEYIFPPVQQIDMEFGDFSFWREQIPRIDFPELELSATDEEYADDESSESDFEQV